ncbi:hypothetical protein D9M71_718960 [compost metagenome]
MLEQLLNSLAAGLRFSGFATASKPELDQSAQVGPFANNLGVGLDIGHRGRVFRQFAQVGESTQIGLVRELLGQGHHVEGFILMREVRDGLENRPMLGAKKILGHQPVGQ